jgi:hypothetical protein
MDKLIIPAREILVKSKYRDLMFIADLKRNSIKFKILETGKYLSFEGARIWCIDEIYLDGDEEWNQIIVWNLEPIMTIYRWELYAAKAYTWTYLEKPMDKPLNALLDAYANTIKMIGDKPKPNAAFIIKEYGKIREVIMLRRINIYEAVEYMENFTIENIFEMVKEKVE